MARISRFNRFSVMSLVLSVGMLPAVTLGFSPGQQVAASASTISAASALGIYGGEGPSTEQALGKSMGRQPQYAMAFLDGTSFQKMEDPSWFISQFRGSGYSMIWGVPILPSSGDYTLAIGATGAYDQYFVTLAEGLVAGGQGNSIIRLGWEFNGVSFPWSARGQAANFIAYWQQIVTAMRSVPGANFMFEWNPNIGDEGAGNLANYYPGNSYVDLIGLDVYDISWGNYRGASAEFTTLETEPYGLDWLASFSAQMGKPMTLPEWGLGWGASRDGLAVSDPGTETSGGDDATYINDMARWISTNNVYEATMWDVNSSLVSPTSNPNGFAAVVHDFGITSSLPAPPVTTSLNKSATETQKNSSASESAGLVAPLTFRSIQRQMWRNMASIWSFSLTSNE